MTFSTFFVAFLKEAQFTKEVLGAGATEIANANYSRKGVYFQAFTSLSTGLERIGKLCVILDHYIKNDGNYPESQLVRNIYGHNLTALYNKGKQIKIQHSFEFEFLDTLEDPIHKSILHVLSDFAMGDRYSNINILVNDQRQEDPILDWYNTVDLPIFNTKVSKRKREKIIKDAKTISNLMADDSRILHISETGDDINDIESASIQTGLHESITPYRRMYVLQIVRFWVELISELQYLCMKESSDSLPSFSEIFAPFYNNDSYFKRRKTWDSLY